MEKIAPEVRHIARRLVQHGFDALVVGGAVRDLLLGREPKDYDIATSARPEEVKEIFGRSARIIGRRFRLVHVYRGHTFYEVSTFRREPTTEERKGRVDDDGVMLWRDNAYGTLEQDAHRRDFTVNALYYDPVGDRGVIDLTGGVADLEARIVRSIGPTEVRMAEDPVRMLRACKLVGQYGFRLAPEVEEAIGHLAPQLRLCSPARLFEEILKILAKPWSASTFQTLHEYELTPAMWPGLAEMWDGPRGPELRRLLAARDARVAAGGYSKSRTLALATLAFSAVEAELKGPSDTVLWERRPGLEKPCRAAIQRFFAPFRVPRYLSARARDLILLLPRFFDGRRRGRVLEHPEYKYSRELFSLLCEVRRWDGDLLEGWPPPHSPPGASGRRRNRRRFTRTTGKASG
ncbi:MAG: polynucleotide adenylyltransferase PcnB [Kiritimatiellaeota bacterium]|nr:polynucleotide adenylyltransferase PcnB [Kiritimatiellota bacterium]